MYLLLFCLLTLTASAGPTKKIVRFSNQTKVGLTIWGVQPGDRVQQLLANLPDGAEFRYDQSYNYQGQRQLILRYEETGQCLNVFTFDEVVVRVGVAPVVPVFSVERDGVTLFTGADSAEALRKCGLHMSDDGSYVMARDNISLSVSFLNPQMMLSASLRREK